MPATRSLCLFAWLCLVSLAAPRSSWAQAPRDGPGGEPPLELPRLAAPIRLDGIVDPGEWEGAVEIEPVMHLPDFRAEPSERTVFLLAYDAEHLYVGCRAYDREQSLVRVTTLARDASPYLTDACNVTIDTYNDDENSLMFQSTPAGVRTDWAFANDASGAPNQDWNAFWDASGTMTDYGWSVEIRVPFSSLGFQVTDDRVVMGFSLLRTVVRRNESAVHPAIPPNWGPASPAKPSQMRKMVIRGVLPRQPVYVTPYALGGGGYTHALDASLGTYDRDSDRVTEAGLDVRYGITRNMNLDLSVNTDFAQVEADDQQVNLTRFSLFFPEKRRFFQERRAIFEVPLGGQERLFHSRRIGLVGGEPVRIFGGARVIGRVGDWDLGFIDMQTDEHDGQSGENLGVLRLRRRVVNDFSYLGGLLTSRVGNDGAYNVMYGTDASVRLFGQDYVTLNWAQSFDDGEAGSPSPLDRGLMRVNWQRRGTDGVVYTADVSRAGEAFEPGMGFLSRRDYLAGDGSVGYGWRPGPGAALNAYSIGTAASFFRRNDDASIESAAYSLNGQLQTRGGHRLSLGAGRSLEDLSVPFRLSPTAAVPPGSYWFNDANLSYTAPSGALLRPSWNATVGQFYDGTRISTGFSPAWSLSRHLTLSGSYQLNRIRFDERGQEFTSHLARLRTELTFSNTVSAAAFTQYNSAGDVVVLNLRFRYNPSEGTDLFLVWNESLNSDRFALTPRPPLSQTRTILVKYARTFTLTF
jgi:hypothetical protein